MIDNSRKTPLAFTLPRSIDNGARKRDWQSGKGLPCHVTAVDGAIVTVAFDIANGSGVTLPPATIPVATSNYDRLPIQKGDPGMANPASTLIGISDGLGGLADLHEPANLSALVFHPVSDKTWTAVDGNARVVQGPNGVVLQDLQKRCVFTLTPTGIVITIGDIRITIADNGAIDLSTTGAITIQGSTVSINP